MKHLLLTTIAPVLLVGCVPSIPDISIEVAAGTGNIEAVKQHLSAGTNVNTKRSGGWSPLHYAVYGGHKEIAELLTNNNADVSAKDQYGTTPLHDLAYGGHKKVAQLLIVKGADVNTKDVGGMTPLDFAIIYNQTEIADLLRKHGGKTNEWFKAEESICIAAKVGHVEAVKKHLDSGVDVNEKNEDGFTPMHYAAQTGYKEITDLLIANGADVNSKDVYERTPLHFAAGYGHKETVELLIAKGADTNAKNNFDATPLDEVDDNETADLLRKHGGQTGDELIAVEK